jgi:protein-disulfide isomerase
MLKLKKNIFALTITILGSITVILLLVILFGFAYNNLDFLHAEGNSDEKVTPAKTHGGILGQPDDGNACILDDNFVIAEYNGKKIRNIDLGERMDAIREQLLNALIEEQLETTEQLIALKYEEKLNSDEVVYYISRPRYKIEILDNDPVRGKKNAPVSIVEFSDYRCGYCRKINPVLQDLYNDNKNSIRHIFKDFAFLAPDSPVAANAAQCVNEQKPEAFWDFQKMLFDTPNLNLPKLKKLAQKFKLNINSFSACVKSNKYSSKIDESRNLGISLGVRGTPAIFINGRFIKGAFKLDELQKIVNDEISLNKKKKNN